MEDKITIGGLCKLSGLSFDTVKWYRMSGLIEGKRDPENGYFYFDDDAVSTLSLIHFMRQIDIPLKDIDKLMHCKTEKIIELYEKQSEVIKQKIADFNSQLEVLSEQIQQYKTLKSRTYAPVEIKEPDFELAYERDCVKALKQGNEKLYQTMFKRNWYTGSLTTKICYLENSEKRFDCEFKGFIAPRKSDPNCVSGDVIWRKNHSLTYICMLGLCRLLDSGKRIPSVTCNSLGTITSGDKLNTRAYLNELFKSGYIAEEIVAKFALHDTDEAAYCSYFDIYIGTRPMNKDEMLKYGISKIIPLEKLIAGEV